MGRLIDADRFIEKVNKDRKHECYLHSWTADDVLEKLNSWYAPTVEAIPKADYEARLKADMVAILEELTKEMILIKECEYQIYGNEHWNFVGKCQDVIQKKIDELREGVKEKPKSCSTCRSYKGHAGHCEICHEMSMYKEKKDE
ncbi:MAG: hypothetical protein J6U54_08610 [Clostridiales bacterium]|nr:hypothetical protein [Clostridiales bacterium]